MKKYRKTIFGIIILALFFGTFTRINMVYANNHYKTTLRVGYTPSNVAYKDVLGNKHGYIFEYMNELNKFGKYNIIYQQEPWSKQLEMLKNHELDLIFFATDTPDRRKDFDYSTIPLGNSMAVLYTKKDSNLSFEEYEAFNGLVIGSVEGYITPVFFEEYAKKNKFSYTIKEYPTKKELNKGLEDNEIDAIVMIEAEADDIEKVIATFVVAPSYIITYKDNPKFKIFDQFARILDIHKPNLKVDLYSKYYGERSFSGFTRDELEYIENSTYTTIGFDSNAAPESYLDEDGNFKGYYVDFLEAISEVSGIKFRYVDKKESYYDATINNEEIKSITQSRPFITDAHWYMAKNKFEFNKNINYTIALRDRDMSKIIRRLHPKWEIIFYNNIEECIEAVNISEVQMTLISLREAEYIKKNPQNYKLKILPNSVLSISKVIEVKNSSSRKLLSILDKSILILQKSKIEELISSSVTSSTYKLGIIDLIQQNVNYIIAISIIFLFIGVATFSKYVNSLNKIAYYDKELEMRNRKYLLKQGNKMINKLVTGSITIIDISKMNSLYVLYGAKEADKIIKFVGNKLKEYESNQYYVFRYHIDSFIIISTFSNEEKLSRFFDNINDAIKEYRDEYIYTKLQYHIGSYVFKEYEDYINCLNKAKMALNTTKKNNDRYMFYDQKMNQKAKKEKEIESKMEDALKREEFKLYLQPKIEIDSKTNKPVICGAESLVRWITSSGKIIYPNDFIPLFEKNGFILNLDYYMFEKTCMLLRNLKEKGIKTVTISVNQSKLQYSNSDYLKRLCDIADKYGIDYNMIEIEFTEYIYSNYKEAAEVVKKIREVGFLTSLDDFGSGYSSFNMLRRKSFDYLKIDKEFLKNEILEDDEKAVLSGIINLSKALEIKPICEGVETKSQLETLKELGCNRFQGYYFYKPMPAKMFEKLIK